MEDLVRLILAYLRGMWRYRWWGLAAAWLVAIAGAAFVFQMPDRYTSSARVYVDTQSVLRPLMSGMAVQPNVGQQVDMLSRTLITRPNVEKLFTMADLDMDVRSDQEREAMIGQLMSRLQISDGGRRGGRNLFSLGYQDENPERAQRVVQALVSLFVESGLVGQRHDTESARRFIDQQIEAYERRLTEAENRMTAFRLQHLEMLSGDGRGFVTQMQTQRDRLEQSRLELREARRLADNLQQQLAVEQPTQPQDDEMWGSAQYSELDGRIDELNRQLDTLLTRYTEQHPDVQSTRRILGNLEQRREQESMMRAETDNGTGYATNPVYQQLKVAVGHAESQVSVLETRVEEYQERLEQLREQAELRPQLEAQLTQLDRDYNIHRQNYQQLVERRERASISAEMEAESGITDFRVIDPPSLPSSPSAPDRSILLIVVALAALGGGGALSFLLSQLRPMIGDMRGLRSATDLPVLGSVGLIADPARVRRERVATFAFFAGVAALVGLMGAASVGVKFL